VPVCARDETMRRDLADIALCVPAANFSPAANWGQVGSLASLALGLCNTRHL
jgi:hypothetical protein